MNIQYQFKNISDQTKEEVRDYADKRFAHLETFLSTYQDDNKMLTVNVEYHQRHNAFEVNVRLQLAGKSLHHKEVKHNIQEVLDLVEANIIRQAKKHIDHLRKDQHKEASIPTPEADDLPEEETTVNYDNI